MAAMTAYSNHLAVDSYVGDINGIGVEWSDNARERLNSQATATGGNPRTLKVASEQLAYDFAKRLGKERVRILASIHNTTTNTANGQTSPHEFHLSVVVIPGQWKVHIYVDGLVDGPTSFDNLTMKGESVMKPKTKGRDRTLSIGTLSDF